MQKRFGYIVGCFVLLLAGGGVWFFLTVGERGKPVVEIGADASVIGRDKALDIIFSDSGRGLRRTEITITQDHQHRVASTVDYPETGVRRKADSITLDAFTLKLHDGPASLTVTAVDHSLWKNRTTVKRQVMIDLLPPRIFQLNTQHHVNPGGTCFVAYRLSEAVVRTGVEVGDVFYPAYPAHSTAPAEKSCYASYFALPPEASPGAPQIRILARDQAGNGTSSDVPVRIQKRKFRSDKMFLTDSFLGQKMPEFQALISELRGKTPLETFTYVNTLLRADNLKTIQSACMKSEPRPLWQGPFLRMKNAAPMALFCDRRTYLYKGKPVGKSLHNGVDLASLVHAPIEAANSGIVRLTEMLGIYGNTVIIDHGMGLSTLYAHMSAIQVKPGQMVKRGEVIGLSGSTGLAGGDHLHFGVAVNGRFVDPREWWDPHWIADNVTKKLDVCY
ncbi:MAG: M23 family metallopeptidase [Deltaproteobacteria bacterium]|nr:M23 family metallopeptidase [Deltaproteobacteria bacterium]